MDASRVSMAGGSFDDASISRSRFLRTDLDRASWVRAIVARSTFESASPAGTNLAGARFYDCDFRRAIFTDAAVNGARFERCMLDHPTRAEITTAGVLVVGAAARIAR